MGVVGVWEESRGGGQVGCVDGGMWGGGRSAVSVGLDLIGRSRIRFPYLGRDHPTEAALRTSGGASTTALRCR